MEIIKVPAMGESITEATVGQILKPSGSHVNMDDELLELETDKVNQVLYAPQAGIVTLRVSTDDVVQVGQEIGTIDTEKGAEAKGPEREPEKPAPIAEPKPKKPVAPPEPEKPSPKPPPPRKPAEGVRKSKETFIEEVLHLPSPPLPQKKEAPTPESRETRHRMTKIRRVIASRLVEAQQTTAMLTTFNDVDLTEVIALRTKYKEQFVNEHGIRLGFMSFFVKAAVSALAAFPDVNGYIEGNEIVHRHYYDIGIAVGTERGLIVPVVRQCDQLSFAGIEKAITDFAQQAREGTLSLDDLQGGGFTITNGGVYGSLLSTPILNPPQSGILGMHKIEKRPIVVDNEIVIRPMMYLALSYDHRIIDGKTAVTFLVHMKNSLEDPARLLLEV